MIKIKKAIISTLAGLTLFTFISDFTVNADNLENMKKVNQSGKIRHKQELHILGKKGYKNYRKDTLRYNNISYGSSRILVTARKIPFNFSNKQSHFDKEVDQIFKLFPVKELIPRNFATSVEAVNETPWSTGSNNDPILQKVYNGRTVYYHINATGKLYNLYQTAIKAWNSLGVIKFVPTDDNNKYVIQLDQSQENSGEGKIEGVTSEGATRYYFDDSNHLKDVHITIDNNVANNTDDFNAISVVEHEIGHALGFAHNNKLLNDGNGYNVAALMNGQADDAAQGVDTVADFNTNNLVGANEQHKLMQMYDLKILPGYYKYIEFKNNL